MTHLLRRAGFGGSPAEIAALAALDIRTIVGRLVDPAAVPLPAPPLLDAEAGHGERYVDMSWSWLERMHTAAGSGALVEKLTPFWHGHFCGSHDKVGHQAPWAQNQLFRTKGLGSFGDLTQAVAIDPAPRRGEAARRRPLGGDRAGGGQHPPHAARLFESLGFDDTKVRFETDTRT